MISFVALVERSRERKKNSRYLYMMSCSKHRILKRRDPVAHFHRYRDNEVDDFFGAVDFSTQT